MGDTHGELWGLPRLDLLYLGWYQGGAGWSGTARWVIVWKFKPCWTMVLADESEDDAWGMNVKHGLLDMVSQCCVNRFLYYV
jgi:hypothetical protein